LKHSQPLNRSEDLTSIPIKVPEEQMKFDRKFKNTKNSF